MSAPEFLQVQDRERTYKNKSSMNPDYGKNDTLKHQLKVMTKNPQVIIAPPNFSEHISNSAQALTTNMLRGINNGSTLVASGLNNLVFGVAHALAGDKYKNYIADTHRKSSQFLVDQNAKTNEAANGLIAKHGWDAYTKHPTQQVVHAGSTALPIAASAALLRKTKALMSGGAFKLVSTPLFVYNFPGIVRAIEAAGGSVPRWVQPVVSGIDRHRDKVPIISPIMRNLATSVGGRHLTTSMQVLANPHAFNNGETITPDVYKLLPTELKNYVSNNGIVGDLLDIAHAQWGDKLNENIAKGYPIASRAAWWYFDKWINNPGNADKIISNHPDYTDAIRTYISLPQGQRYIFFQRIAPALYRQMPLPVEVGGTLIDAADKGAAKASRGQTPYPLYR